MKSTKTITKRSNKSKKRITATKKRKPTKKKSVLAKKTAKKVVAKKTTKKKESTHIIAVLDRSFSMKEVANDAINGFNSFLNEQKQLKDKATFSGVLFDDQFEPLNDGKIVDIKKVSELTNKTFVPRGTTALYDAIGKSVNLYKSETQKNKRTKPAEKVLVIVVTDGHENASREFSRNDIADLITYQKKQNWQFLFLCSTEDAITVGTSLGISRGNTFKFDNTSQGNADLYAKISFASTNYRSMSSNDSLNFSDSLLSDGDEG